MKLSIIVPAHNEEENISEVIDRIEQAVSLPHELIVVNDHSRDRTPELVRESIRRYPNVRLVDNQRPGGFANAVRTGLEAAGGEVVVPVMGDLCDDLATIPLMYEKITAGYDVVCGCRYTKGGSRLGGSLLKGALSCAAGWSAYFLLGIPTHDIANAFKMYRKSVIAGLATGSRGFEVSMEVVLKAYFSGAKITEVPTVWKERQKGKSSFRIFKLLPYYLKLYLWAITMRFKRKGAR